MRNSMYPANSYKLMLDDVSHAILHSLRAEKVESPLSLALQAMTEMCAMQTHQVLTVNRFQCHFLHYVNSAAHKSIMIYKDFSNTAKPLIANAFYEDFLHGHAPNWLTRFRKWRFIRKTRFKNILPLSVLEYQLLTQALLYNHQLSPEDMVRLSIALFGVYILYLKENKIAFSIDNLEPRVIATYCLNYMIHRKNQEKLRQLVEVNLNPIEAEKPSSIFYLD